MAESLLFIPDISGFTDFVNATEISHSQHIISELLELLANANEMDMVLSEIEGDALLFYKENQVPSLAKVIKQSENMFLKFHEHLKRYEKERICECGACTTAAGLTLKMVVHRGEIGFIKVQKFLKPHGQSLIVVHRMLKNTIPSREYLMLSEGFLEGKELDSLQGTPDWGNWATGSCEFESYGSLGYFYLPLSPLYRLVPDPPPLKVLQKTKKPVVLEERLAIKPEDLYELVSNLDKRLTWMTEITTLEYEKDRVNRVGEKHLCLLEQGTFEFETVTNDFGPGTQVYGERTTQIPFIKEATTYWVISPEGEGSRLRVEAHFRPAPFIGFLIMPMVKSQISAGLRKAVNQIKKSVMAMAVGA